MKKIVLYDWSGNHIKPWLKGFISYFENKGFVVDVIAGKCDQRTWKVIDGEHDKNWWLSKIKNAEYVFMWNGAKKPYDSLKNACHDLNIPFAVLEVGWFPQNDYYFVDPDGINGDSSIIYDDLSWVNNQHYIALEEFREKYLKGRKWQETNGYILIPLQLENDTNILCHSPFKKMQEFIDHVEPKFPNEQLLFKRHPLDNNRYICRRGRLVCNGNFLDLAMGAKKVYGINSTCLLEAALLGVPVESIGSGYLNAHAHQIEKLLAALVDKQIPVNKIDLDYWILPYFEKKKIVSVVIPCYKHAKTLPAAIDSVLSQTFEDIEIIVVNDGSPDNTSEVVKGYQEKYGKDKIVLVEQENKGLPAARNAGFGIAKGEFVIPLDADDMMDKEMVESLWKESKDSDVIYGEVRRKSGQQIEQTHDPKLLVLQNRLSACAMIRKKSWEKVGGYTEEMIKGYEDWEFWIKCHENDIRFKKVKDAFFIYDDTNPNSMVKWCQVHHVELHQRLVSMHPYFFGVPNAPKPYVTPVYADSISVVISSWNQRKTLPYALQALAQQTVLPKEVIIADDGSTDGTLEWLDSLSKDVYPFPVSYVTRDHTWYRLASILNMAASHVTGERVLMTNADQVHCPESLEAHLSLSDNEVGGGVFKGIKMEAVNSISLDMIKDFRQVIDLSKKYPSKKNNLGYIEKTNPNYNPIGVWGGNVSYPISYFRKVNGYNEAYDIGWGGEENDLTKRLVKIGCRVKWVMDSEIYHLDHSLRSYSYKQLGSKKYLQENG